MRWALLVVLCWGTESAALLRVVGPPAGAVRLPANRWAYQLQDLRLRQLRESAFGLLVIDYAVDGDEATELSAKEVAKLRSGGPCGTRTVLAYMSIGEAEDYRFYWDRRWVDDQGDPGPEAPSWLGPTNPAWAGNYKVRYWERNWRRVLFGTRNGPARSYLDRIIDAGFDGVYLDIVDGYGYWGPAEIGGTNERREAAADMVRLVRALGRYARRERGRSGFLIVPQNGAGIIDQTRYPDATDPAQQARRQRHRYFRAIDAIGTEDTFFFGNRDQNNGYRPQRDTIEWLDQFHAAGKTVLAIDYLTQPEKIDRFWQEVVSRGWLPYVSDRDLNQLTIPAGHSPACGVSP